MRLERGFEGFHTAHKLTPRAEGLYFCLDMSDSESDSPRASDARISRALKSAVANCFKNEDFDSITVRRIREIATTQLKLPKDFLKSDKKWNVKSKEIINSEVAKHDPPTSQASPQPKRAPTSPMTTQAEKRKPTNPQEKKATGSKRKSIELKPMPNKKQKRSLTPEDEQSDLSDAPPSKSVLRNDTPITLDDVESEEEGFQLTTKRVRNVSSEALEVTKRINDTASESELSVVLDDIPPPKNKRQKSASADSGKTKPVKNSKSKPETSSSVSNQQDDEVKKLQGWLVKCGVRRVWSRELASCSSARERIGHLKGLLKDVGMTGRFSEDKAKQIKEEREFKADLEAIQDGNKHWGQSDGEESGGDGGQPKRRIARGLKELQQFDDDEESD